MLRHHAQTSPQKHEFPLDLQLAQFQDSQQAPRGQEWLRLEKERFLDVSEHVADLGHPADTLE